ncbi:MAG: hypothetical protein PUB32_02630 [Clostridiales bacterium]|nr:hypothetical protein [Clostridiales bacterium]
MKAWKKVLCVLIVLLILLALLAGLAYWQRDYLRALKVAIQYTSEELEEKLAENQQMIQEAMDAHPDIIVRPITEEERQELLEGTLPREELIQQLLKPSEEGKEPDQESGGQNEAAPENTPVPTESPKPVEPDENEKTDYQQELSAIVAQVYVLQAEYTGILDNMFEAAKAEYLALPKEQRTRSNMLSIGSRYLNEATELEKQCDAEMDDIVSSMASLIEANNGDMDLVDTVIYTYANEKSLKKSWYMSQLKAHLN